MQTNGKRTRLRSVAATGRPFFRLSYDRLAAFDDEVEAIENGSDHRLQGGLAEIQRRKADMIASAETWRHDRIMNIENEFDGAIKAAVDQYNEDLRHLRTRLVDEVKRNRRRYVDTNGLTSPQMQRKKARMPSTMQAASTRSASAAMQSQQPKPVTVKIKLSDDEIRSDLKKIAKPFVMQPPQRSPRRDFVCVKDGVLYIGNYKFRIGDQVRCGRRDELRDGVIEAISVIDVDLIDVNTKQKFSLPLSFLRTGISSLELYPGPDLPLENDELSRLNMSDAPARSQDTAALRKDSQLVRLDQNSRSAEAEQG